MPTSPTARYGRHAAQVAASAAAVRRGKVIVVVAPTKEAADQHREAVLNMGIPPALVDQYLRLRWPGSHDVRGGPSELCRPGTV